MTESTTAPGATRARPGASTIVITLAFVWVSMALASAAWWPVYESVALVTMAAVAVVTATLAVLVPVVLRWPTLAILPLAMLGYFAVGVPVAVPSKAVSGVLPTVEGFVDLIAGVALGWKQMLTITLPVGDYEALLVPAFALIYAATVVCLTMAFRSAHPSWAAIAPVVVTVVALAFGAVAAPHSVPVAVALLVVLLGWLAWLRWSRRRAAIRLLTSRVGGSGLSARSGAAGVRTTIGAVVILAVASTAGVVAAGAIAPGGERDVLRTRVEQPFDPRTQVSPLSGFRSNFAEGRADAVLFTVEGMPEGALLRLATLDSYDGVVYSVGSSEAVRESGAFTRVPVRIDVDDVVGDDTSISVGVADYDGIWLPTLGVVAEVRFTEGDRAALRDSYYLNATSQTAVVLGGLSEGDAYRVDAVVAPPLAIDEVRELTPGPAVVPNVTGVPEQLTVALSEYVGTTDGAGERLAAMLNGLARDGYISHGGADEPASRSGHAADRIAELLTAPRMLGDAEQYAVAAALMAGELGFPARVVQGFVPENGAVRGADATAWVEVNTAEAGWVAIDPNPPVRDIPDEAPDEESLVSRPLTIVPPPPVETERSNPGDTPDTQEDVPEEEDSWLAVVIVVAKIAGIALGALLLLCLPLIVIVARKAARRRRRRKAKQPVSRIQGGWNEFQDALVDYRVDVAPAATRAEVAAVAGGSKAAVLASVVDRATFAPEAAEPDQADAVWRTVDDLRAEIGRGSTRWQRFRARISLRSFGRL